MKTFLVELEARFLEETNYNIETENMAFFRDKNPFPSIKIPKVYPEYSAKTVLSMDYLEGLHLEDWLETNPSQKERNHVAQSLWDFFVHFLVTEQCFHADPNPGDYLIMADGSIGILDFGCIKRCDPEFPEQISTMIGYYTNNDMTKIVDMLHRWGMIPNISERQHKKVENAIFCFQNWITTPFRTKTFDFAKQPDYMAQRFSKEFRATMDVMHNTNHNFVMFDRTFMGLLSIFNVLNAELRFHFDSEII